MLEFNDLKFLIVGSTVEIKDDQDNTLETINVEQSHQLYNFLKEFIEEHIMN